eukprot:TRINITY_DN2520_c0_g1_i2.p1 TRINITY_DN2520_c0_g1~~TRINITY_DN2520_c0_g1_i2.p1  ORF type:complete len:221 (+),score=53.03 TRINITY_DN2520_c0_g1_i2:87-665(+)
MCVEYAYSRFGRSPSCLCCRVVIWLYLEGGLRKWGDGSTPQSDIGNRYLSNRGNEALLAILCSGFQERPYGWHYAVVGSDAVKLQISAFSDVVMLTPIFGSEQTYTVNIDNPDFVEFFEQKIDLKRNGQGSSHFVSSILLNAKKFREAGVRAQKFTFNFGPEYADTKFYVHFDPLDYKMDIAYVNLKFAVQV